MVTKRLLATAFALLPILACGEVQVALTVDGLASVGAAAQSTFAAPLNESFRVHVTISTDRDRPNEIAIAGLDNFQRVAENSSSSIQIINGKRSSTHTYELELMPVKEGSFVLGPAVVKDSGLPVESSSLTINVAKDAPRPRQNSSAETQLCTAELIASKKNPFVWEPFVLTVKINAREDAVSEVQVNEPTFEGFEAKRLTSNQRRATINNHPYVVVENNFLLTPNKAGKRQLGPVTVQYRAQVRRENREPFFEDIFDSFFGHGMRGREGHIKASPIAINVRQMPSEAHGVNGIGLFNKLTLHTDKQEVTAHEPIKLTLTISGEGNFDQVEAPKLHLPAPWKVYSSATKFNPHVSNSLRQTGEKEFEYILQIPTVGKVELPKQKFSFFDPECQTVAELQTDPIALTINPRVGEVVDVVGPTPKVAVRDEQEEAVEKAPVVETLEGYVAQNAATSHGLPWLWFFFLAILPFIGGGLLRVYRWWHRSGSPRNVVSHTLAELERLESQGKVTGIYGVITAFCAKKMGAKEAGRVDEAWLYEHLKGIGMAHGKVESFVEFLNEVASFNFASPMPQRTDMASLFGRARTWVKQIDGYLKGRVD